MSWRALFSGAGRGPSARGPGGAGDDASSASNGSGRSSFKDGFRPDVEGLRALAVGAVLLYHAGLPFAPGGYVGVDMFFVISGFLITGLLLSEMERTGTVSLKRFYSRRAKRLLPVTVVVLGVTVVLSRLLLSPVRMDQVSFDVAAAGLYVVNWRLGAQAVDYLAAGLGTSPVQHFWSLAVEEQFYVVWPALLLIFALRSRQAGRNPRPALAVAVTAVAVSSFAYNVHITGQEAGSAYFSTLARAWEFALGGALALVPASRLRLPRAATFVLGWAGVGAVAWSVVRFGEGTTFPGTAALVPVLGTVAIIAAGSASRNSSGSSAPLGFLTLSPVRHVGRISYSWYLWHWPPLVFATAVWGELSLPNSVAIVAATWILAVLSYHLVENPFLNSRQLSLYPSKALTVGAACTVSSVALGLMLFATTPNTEEASGSQIAGAAELEERKELQKSADAIRPTPRNAKDDRPLMYKEGCQLGLEETDLPECVFGNPSAETTVFLLGDSHAMQWFGAVNELAKERDWRLVAITKTACPLADIQRYNVPLGRIYHECGTWRKNMFERIERERPGLVIATMQNPYTAVENGRQLGPAASDEALENGFVEVLRNFRDDGAEVAVIKDNPHPNKDIPDCVSQSLQDLEECATPRDKAFNYPPVNARAANRVDGAKLIDAEPMLCLEDTCPAVIGDVLVYRNGDHITSTYIRTLTPWLGEQLPAPATP